MNIVTAALNTQIC